MNFCDETTVTLKAGNGGGGCASFRREKYISMGGPDGGNGGSGGNVILKTNENINTLVDFNTKKSFKATSGGSGAKRNQNGHTGSDLILEVPLGTIVKDEDGNVIADLKFRNQEVIIAKGGMGGKGNAQFASSTRQAPNFAELGEPGEELTVHMELKLVAEIGIIGLPSAGKSTLISRISAVKPKIAEYHFTTLVPNLGVVDMKPFGGSMGESFTVVDIPGLIEGAAEGKGLGHEFLRHVGRAKFLIHLLDGSLGNLRESFDTINAELAKYSKDLAEKDQVVVINKTDILIEELYPEIEKEFAEFKKKNKLFFISALTGDGLKDLMFSMWGKVKEMRVQDQDVLELLAKTEDHKTFRPHLLTSNHQFEVELIDSEKVTSELQEGKKRMTHKERIKKKELRDMLKEGEITEEEYEDQLYELINGFKKEDRIKKFSRQIFEIKGKRLEQIVIMTDTNSDEAVDRVHDVIRKMDINKKLVAKGAALGDVIMIAGKRFYFRN
ncbi:MAG: GTPase ObgE [Candidatus Peregrinibacteria bacterium]|nr:GTPase ObgE [Candidatus Peregrinibacteria bacterium]MDZ4245080.1 GTPase ObgE [Candidatus Gracilibacteria bacterium]